MRILALCATILAVAGPAFATADPAALQANAGDWRLSEVGGKVACTLTLTRQTSPSGYEVKAPLACRRAFPPLKLLATWAPDDKGGILLSDAEAKPIVDFAGQAASTSRVFEARAPDGRTWRLEPLKANEALAARPHMPGDYRLTSGAGATLCDFTLRPGLFTDRGSVGGAACTSGWSEKRPSTWWLRGDHLSLLDREGRTLLLLKPSDTGAFVAADPKADPMTLARRPTVAAAPAPPPAKPPAATAPKPAAP